MGNLAAAIEAQKAGFLKGLEGIETKLMRAGKKNLETSLNQIRSVKAKLFPEQHLAGAWKIFHPGTRNTALIFQNSKTRIPSVPGRSFYLSSVGEPAFTEP